MFKPKSKARRLMWIALAFGAGMTCIVALIQGNSLLARGNVILLGVLGTIFFFYGMIGLKWHKAPVPIGTPVRTFLLLLLSGSVMAIVCWHVWPADGSAKVDSQPKPPSYSGGFVQLATEPRIVGRRLQVGKPLKINVALQNMGSEPVDDFYRSYRIATAQIVDPTKADKTLHDSFMNQVAKDQDVVIKQNIKGMTLGVKEIAWNTVPLEGLNKKQINGIKNGIYRLYIFVWASWKNAKHPLDMCLWLQAPRNSIIPEPPIWHGCAL